MSSEPRKMPCLTLEELGLLGKYLRKARRECLSKEEIEGVYGLRGILYRVDNFAFHFQLRHLLDFGAHVYDVERRLRTKRGLPVDRVPASGTAVA